jgi:hypothetical protein
MNRDDASESAMSAVFPDRQIDPVAFLILLGIAPSAFALVFSRDERMLLIRESFVTGASGDRAGDDRDNRVDVPLRRPRAQPAFGLSETTRVTEYSGRGCAATAENVSTRRAPRALQDKTRHSQICKHIHLLSLGLVYRF